jgi:glycosyltransferase involved in cell wall biosynthesis
MHVAQLIYAHDPDLTEPEALLDRYTTLTRWSDALVSAGAARVTVALPFTCDAVVERGHVSYHFVRPARGWPHALAHGRLHRRLAALNPDLLHLNGLSFPMEACQLRYTFPRTPIVLQDHANRPARRPLRRALQRAGFRAADGVLFAAAPLADPWRAAGLIPRSQPVFAVMESSTDLTPVPRERARAETALPGAPALLWVGRLNANKDPLTVLSGFERALPQLGDAQLTMLFHTTELRAEVERYVQGSGLLAGRVHLRGRVAHQRIAAFHSAADLFVLGSHHEGSGYALLEAMACGAVPVVTDIPSFRAMTGGGAVGALWPAGDAGAFAAALVRCAGPERGIRSDQVRARFSRHLSWPVVGREAMRIYRAIAAAPRTGRSGAGAVA